MANATDFAKAAASLVPTEPGLANIVNAVQTSRRIHWLMLTYMLCLTKSSRPWRSQFSLALE